MEEKRKGFFGISRLRLILLCTSLALAIIMFLPFIMSGVTGGGTGYHCIFSCILMCLNPVFIFIDFLFNK